MMRDALGARERSTANDLVAYMTKGIAANDHAHSRNVLRGAKALALIPILNAIAGAQIASGSEVLRGAVFDSLSGTPLPGAVVQLARSDGKGTPMSVRADSTGRYRFRAVAAGRYIVGFDDSTVTALGLEPISREVSVDDRSVATIDLAIPSASTLVRLRCPNERRTDRGMLFGRVFDAYTKSALPNAILRVQWNAIEIGDAAPRVVVERVSAHIAMSGDFVVCGLPAEVALDLAVEDSGHYTLAGPLVNVPQNGIARLDLALGDASLTGGRAVLRGSVKRRSGQPVPSARLLLAALKRDVPVSHGAFVMGDLPLGTWAIELRVIGEAPRVWMVTTSADAVNDVTLTAEESPRQLEAVTVVGKVDRTTRILEEVLRRRNHASGTFFLPGSWALQMAHQPSDVMKSARGFRYRSATNVKSCPVSVFVDDAFLPGGFEYLDQTVDIGSVLAIETYPSIGFAPIQYRFGFGDVATQRRPCAAVVIWTNRRF